MNQDPTLSYDVLTNRNVKEGTVVEKSGEVLTGRVDEKMGLVENTREKVQREGAQEGMAEKKRHSTKLGVMVNMKNSRLGIQGSSKARKSREVKCWK